MPGAGRPVREARSYDFSQGWLFGGRYVEGAEQPGFDDGGFEQVTLPHTVTSLSWDNWDPASWEGVWIYRKHVAGAASRGRAGAGGLRWCHDERHCGAQRLDGRNSRRRLPALDGRTDQLRDRGRQRPGGHRRCALARRSARRRARRPVIDGLSAAGRHLPRRDAARRAGDLPGRRLRAPAERAEQRPRRQGPGDGQRGSRTGREHGDHHRHPARRQPRPGRGQHHRRDHRDRYQHRRPHDRPDRPGDLLVAGEPQALHGPDDPVLRTGRGPKQRAHGHDDDRLPRGRLHRRRLLPQRRPL